MVFNENMNWEDLLRKKKEFYKRMETDIDFRLEQVDKKLMTMNALESKDRYFRYQLTVHDTMLNDDYLIGLYGQLSKRPNGTKSY